MQSTTASGGTDTGGRRAKAAGAFRTISEVAEELDVAQHVLRFWESKFPQVRPLKRGGGRRYYRPEDVDLLRRIRSLLYEEGYTIKGAQKLLKSQRRTPADRSPARETSKDRTPHVAASKDDGQEMTVSADETGGHVLDTEQKQTLCAIRDELVELRDTLRKFTP